MPIAPTNEEMPKYGWLKAFRCGFIVEVSNGVFFLEVYDFSAETIPCSLCGTTEFSWIILMSSGVFWACGNCRISEGPLARDKFGVLIDRREVTIDQAINVCRQTGQPMSKRMLDALQKQRSQPKGRKPPTKEFGVL